MKPKMSRKTILLIQPPFYRLFIDGFSYNRCPPSLSYLAATIRENTQHLPKIYNADFNPKNQSGASNITFSFRSGEGYKNYLNNLNNLNNKIWEEVRKKISEVSPHIIGITTMTPNFESAKIVARIAKELNSDVKIIIGGSHPSIVGKESISSKYIDFGVKGEGETTIIELINAIVEKNSFSSVNGICYKSNGNIFETQDREYLKDLNTLSHPQKYLSEVLIDFKNYPTNSFNNIFANRGCPFNCAFCASRKVWSRKVRFRPTQHVIREIKEVQKLGVRTIYFCDDTFGVNQNWLKSLCNEIKDECKGIRWSCEIHARLINVENLSVMRNAGCYKIELGIESGNNEILKKIRKQITIEEAIEAAKRIKKLGIELHCYFLVGFPFETMDDIEDTFNAIKKLKNNASIMISIFCPYPNTELFEYCIENKIIDNNYNIALHNHQSIHCFAKDINQSHFESKVKEIEEFVDKSNKVYRLKRIISKNTFWRIKELGLMNSLSKAKKIMHPTK